MNIDEFIKGHPGESVFGAEDKKYSCDDCHKDFPGGRVVLEPAIEGFKIAFSPFAVKVFRHDDKKYYFKCPECNKVQFFGLTEVVK